MTSQFNDVALLNNFLFRRIRSAIPLQVCSKVSRQARYLLSKQCTTLRFSIPQVRAVVHIWLIQVSRWTASCHYVIKFRDTRLAFPYFAQHFACLPACGWAL